jgi:hypothetical protein
LLHIWSGDKAEAFVRSLTTLKIEINSYVIVVVKVFLSANELLTLLPNLFRTRNNYRCSQCRKLVPNYQFRFIEVNVIKERREFFIFTCAWLGRRGPVKLHSVFLIEIKLLFSAV